jgi:hypothetical protein
MNQLIVAGARRGERRLRMPFARSGGESSTTTAVLRERLSGALDDLERAKRAGDPDEVDFHEFRVDRIRAEAQAARTAAEPEQPPAGRFDGGFRGRKPPPAPGGAPLTGNALFRQAITQSRVERAERDADEQTIVVNNI